MRKMDWYWGSLVVFLLVATIGWVAWARTRPLSPEAQALEQAMNELMEAIADPLMRFDDRQALSERFKEQFENSPPEVKAEYETYQARRGKNQGPQFIEAMQRAQGQFFRDLLAASPEEQLALLDRLIDVVVETAEKFAAIERNQNNNAPQQPVQSFGTDAESKSAQAAGQRRMLDRVSPEFRAMGDEVGRRMFKRMAERGIELPY